MLSCRQLVINRRSGTGCEVKDMVSRHGQQENRGWDSTDKQCERWNRAMHDRRIQRRNIIGRIDRNSKN